MSNHNLYLDIHKIVNEQKNFEVLYKTFIGSPTKDIPMKYIKQATSLISSGGQVDSSGLQNRLLNSYLLALCVDKKDDQVISVAAVKKPNQFYKESVFEKANVPDSAEDHKYELGYLITDEKYRNRGISMTLTKKLLNSVKNEYIYATSGNRQVVNRLVKLGFEVIGEPYKGMSGNTLYLMSKV